MEQEIRVNVLQELFSDKSKYLIDEQKGHQGVSPNNYDGRQGEYNEEFKFYRHPGMPENLFMRETYHTDSYGYGDFLQKIEFVKGVEKTVKVFEPI